MHIEKSFWLSWPWFSYSILGNFGFRKYFITLIEILLKDQLLCAMHGGTSTQNFNLEREACQCDPISTYLFILTLHILFLIKKTPWKRQRNIRALFLLYCLCRQPKFFLKDSQSISYLVEIFNTFPFFSGLKLNVTKCKIAGTGALKGVQLAIYGMEYIDLHNEAIKILGPYFWYYNTIKE